MSGISNVPGKIGDPDILRLLDDLLKGSKGSSQLAAQIAALGVPARVTGQWSDSEDAEISLGGRLNSYHLQIGQGYYMVCKATPKGTFISIDGRGNLPDEIERLEKSSPDNAGHTH